jgi:hypothetical protein
MKRDLPAYYLFSLLAVIFTASCKSGHDKGEIPAGIVNNPNTASHEINKASLPRIQFNEEEHNFGKVIEGELVSYSFQFTNTGNSDLLITSVSTSCGCTATKYPKEPIAPGQEGYVEVTFDSDGRSGFQNKTVTVLANTQPNTTTISIKAQVESPEHNP